MVPEKLDYHYPRALRNDYKKNLDKAIDAVKDGLPPKEACMMVYGIAERTWYEWKEHAIEDAENGQENAPLVHLMCKLAKQDIETHKSLVKKGINLALDDENPNVEMLKFMLERRYGYKKQTTNEVEVSAPEDFNFNINITESEPKTD